MKLRMMLILLAAWAFAPPAAIAQEKTPGRARVGGRQPSRARGERHKSLYARIRDQLALDDEQQAEYDAIVEKYKKERRSGARATKAGGKRSRGIVGGRGGASRKGGAKGADLRGRRGHGGPGGGMDAFFDEVEGILHDDQLEKLADIRTEYKSRRRGRGGAVEQLRRLQTDLKLNDEQNQRYEELLAKLEDTIKSPSAGGEDLAAIIEEIRAAAEAGDTERVKELRGRLPNRRDNKDRAVAQFLDEVESFLEPEQMKTLERYKRNLRAGRDATNLRECFRFVSRLDLDREQRSSMREIQRDSTRSLRDVRRDPDETARVTAETQEKLREMLNDEQVAEFDRWLESKKSDRSGRSRHGDRARRNGARGVEPGNDDTP